MSTESTLRDWRYGHTQAERLCAALLYIEGFERVDPQAPLGGPDGGKDIVCSKDRKRWVGAVYFPSTHPSFTEVRNKFQKDLAGARTLRADGFAFFVNQPLTLPERAELTLLAQAFTVELYHLERIRGLLDSPKGYGYRLEFLRIPMTQEEQFALWNELNYDLVRKLLDNGTRFDRLEAKIDVVLARTRAMEIDLTRDRSSLTATQEGTLEVEMPVAHLSIATLCWIHRLVSDSAHLPEAVRGRLRSVQVWIDGVDESIVKLPPAEEVVPRTRELVAWWRSLYPEVARGTKSDAVRFLSEFHHRFLCVHPFIDANGRVARVLLEEGARELLNLSVSRQLTSDPAAYISALRAADNGDLGPLTQLIGASLE